MDTMKNALNKAGVKGSEGKPRQNSSGHSQAPAKKPFKLQKNYSAQAEQVILELQRDKSSSRNFRDLTTSKIRNILAKVSEIYNDVILEPNETLSPELQSRIEYLKVRLIYECGREPKVVKPFVEKAGLLDLLSDIGDNRQKFIEYAHYIEALVAYHRFHGGHDY